MPVYVFHCDVCGQNSETLLGMDEPKRLRCLNCGAEMRREYTVPRLGGDLPSKWAGYDAGLGMEIRDKGDRDREMQRRGLSEFVPDPEMEAIRRERRYIRASTKGGSAAEIAAGEQAQRRLAKEAGRKRRQRILRRYSPD